MNIPSSLTSLIGSCCLQLGTSYDATKFFLDVPGSNSLDFRTRFGYSLSGARIVRSDFIENLLGRIITNVYDGGTEGNNYRKLVFESNPTGSRLLYCVLYFELIFGVEDGALLCEDGVFLSQESGLGFILLDDFFLADDITFTDTTIPRNTMSNENTDVTMYIVQENNFKDLY